MKHRLQAALLLVSALAALLLSFQEPTTSRWGYVVGLAGQPLWLVITWRAGQWGMFVLALWYCGTWTLGIVNHF